MLAKRPYLSAILLVVLGLTFGITLVSGFGSWKGMNLAFGASDPQLGGPLPSLPNDANLQSMNNSMIAVAKAIQPTVVQITVKTEAPKPTASNGDQNPFKHFFNFPFGGDQGGDDGSPFDMPSPGPQEGLGSGVIITSDGYILTNNHVVKDAAKKGGIRVKLMDKRVYDGHVVGTDPTTDIAVVKVDATNLPVAAIGNSDEVAVGEMVIAVGNPLGLESTVTQGIVSSLVRQINIFDPKETGRYSIANFIQTDAAINPGNSGGGLFDTKGAVIGINTAIASQGGMFEGYGFAVPINMARAVAMDLIKTGKVNRGYIGVTIKEVDQTDAEALGMDRPRGVRVDGIQKGGAGEDAGIKENDVILSVDGHETNQSNQLQGLIGMHHAGDQVTLHILRDGREMDKVVKLKPRTDLSTAENTSTNTENNSNSENEVTKDNVKLDNIGLSARNLTGAEKDKYGNGVMITNVQSFSEAGDRALQSGMVITQVAHQSIKNVTDLESAINANKGKSIGLMVTSKDGDSHFMSIRIPNE